MIDIESVVENTKGLSLLYVEDDEEARGMTLLLLSEVFEDIIIASNGKEGLQKYKENNIDIVLTDISMPLMDGLEMCKEIKSIDDEQAIIILTAITTLDTIKEAIEIGIDSFLNKPLSDINILFDKINNIAKRIQYEKEKQTILKLKHEKDKTELVFKMIQNILHHWKQPLSTISTIASSIHFKVEHNLPVSNDELAHTGLIIEKTEELSTILDKLERLQVNNITIEDIEQIIHISNPIYKRE